MHPHTLPRGLVLLALAALAGLSSADEPTKSIMTATPVVTPCVATATNGAFFDLRPDTALVIGEGEKPPKGARTEDYSVRGWDYKSNFTLNICESVVKEVKDVVGVDKELWRNVSAYYEFEGKVYSLGYDEPPSLSGHQEQAGMLTLSSQQSGTLHPKGRKLVLQYTDGSPCETPEKSKEKRSGPVHDGARYKHHEFDDQDEQDDYSARRASPKEDKEDRDGKKNSEKDKEKDQEKEKEKEKDKSPRRKSALISFLCDRDPDTPTAASFLGTDPYECAYFFEVRSQHACASAEPHKPGSVGPGSVFAIIFFIAVLVYVVGGVFYQRTVAHARGWRQLPNYSLWAGIWSFVKVGTGTVPFSVYCWS